MTTYDEYLEQLKQMHQITAREGTKILYELLKKEDPHLSKDDMYDRIMKDCLTIWAKATIIQNMPDELKDKERQESGRKGAEIKKEIIVTNDGTVAKTTEANQSPIEQKKQESPSFNTADETLSDDEDEDAPTSRVIPPNPNATTMTADEIKELREIAERCVKEHAFKPAAAAIAENKSDEVFLSMDHWSTMFMIMRNGEKKGFWCKVRGNEIVNVEANYVRAKKAQAQGPRGVPAKH